ncbi:MAG: SDR family NAD(P)-dependent oxidoreductase [Gammaproteobacteria bacterium]|nr:MAG: SDR family NAD(P)-dependent oxidoreductase [Gammaproteobacteria bacterium]
MKPRTALITGANGGVGRSLCHTFRGRGWRVIATDIVESVDFQTSLYLPMDLNRIATDDEYCKNRIESLLDVLRDGLDCLVNNAAYQVVAPIEELSVSDWHKAFNTNVTSAFLLVRELLGPLRSSRGSVVNIASIHAQLTKPNFTAYAASKAALEGLTRALAVEIGDRVRVNAIVPAAVSTPMLAAGFDDSESGLAILGRYHPSNCIGEPVDVAKMAYFLADSDSRFLNGSVIGLDGGIASRLHDPD